VGDIIIDGGDIYGDDVNLTARLEGVAEPGGICVSGRVLEDTQGKVDVAFEDAGEQQLKNILRPVRVYRARISSTRGTPRPIMALPDKPSIAVLPFQNMSGDPEQEYFADGMVEEIITALSRIRWLFVIARNSSFTYKGKSVDVKQVGRDLGVRYVLEGSVRKAGNRIRITGQLIDASSGAHLWADHFDGALEDIFELQDKVAVGVAGVIEPTLLNAEVHRGRRNGRPTTSPLTTFICGHSRQPARGKRTGYCVRWTSSDRHWSAILSMGPPSVWHRTSITKFMLTVGQTTRTGLGATAWSLLSGRCGTLGAIQTSSRNEPSAGVLWQRHRFRPRVDRPSSRTQPELRSRLDI